MRRVNALTDEQKLAKYEASLAHKREYTRKWIQKKRDEDSDAFNEKMKQNSLRYYYNHKDELNKRSCDRLKKTREIATMMII